MSDNKTAKREAARPIARSVGPAPSRAFLRSHAFADLLAMHTFRRAALSRGEARFVAQYVDSIPGIASDKAGNRWIQIGDSPVMWSSHTDSVHGREESDKATRQSVVYGDGMLTLREGERAACLGADCAAGAWIMREMIARGVQGLYVFHSEEECGGFGSEFFARTQAARLRDISACIAFDRRGAGSVITHQGRRTASDAFADSLAAMLGGSFMADSGGTFTDSANYADIIPECSNISIGYHNAHTPDESLDVAFLADLLERVCALDVSRFVIERDPAKCEESVWTRWGKEESGDDLESLCGDDPATAAAILADMGVTPADFDRAKWQRIDEAWERMTARAAPRITRRRR